MLSRCFPKSFQGEDKDRGASSALWPRHESFCPSGGAQRSRGRLPKRNSEGEAGHPRQREQPRERQAASREADRAVCSGARRVEPSSGCRVLAEPVTQREASGADRRCPPCASGTAGLLRKSPLARWCSWKGGKRAAAPAPLRPPGASSSPPHPLCTHWHPQGSSPPLPQGSSHASPSEGRPLAPPSKAAAPVPRHPVLPSPTSFFPITTHSLFNQM